MARRIIIETDLTCEHGVTGRNHLVTTNERKRDGSAVVVECVAGTEVRVLDPGSFVLIEKVDGEWPEWAKESLSDPPLYELSPSAQRELGGDGEAVKVKPRFILDALAGGEQ